MKDFIIVRKGNNSFWKNSSADEKQRIMEKYFSFVNRLKRENRFKGGSNLEHDGIRLFSENGVIIADGPFAESKEALHGYLILAAKDKDEAVEIARECPALTHGEAVEVFQLG